MPNATKTNPKKTASIALLGRPLQSRARARVRCARRSLGKEEVRLLKPCDVTPRETARTAKPSQQPEASLARHRATEGREA
jgi:hypothetical protein